MKINKDILKIIYDFKTFQINDIVKIRDNYKHLIKDIINVNLNGKILFIKYLNYEIFYVKLKIGEKEYSIADAYLEKVI